METQIEAQIEEKSKGDVANSKVSYIAIPEKLICNRQNGKEKDKKEINTKAKYLYIILKMVSHNDKVNIYYNNLIKKLGWTDKRTLQKYLKILKDNKYIDYAFDRIVGNSKIEISLKFKKPFIQIDRELLERGIERGIERRENTNKEESNLTQAQVENGIILLYYLENKYNSNWGYACPNREEILNVIGINNGGLSKIINYYHSKYICEFCQGEIISNLSKERELQTKENINKNQKNSKMRLKNRYIVNNMTTNKERRYKIHKNKEYFFKIAEYTKESK